MSKLIGWIGPAHASALAAEIDPFVAQAASPGANRSTGPGWRGSGPSVAEDGNLVALVRGDLIWLTKEPRIAQERSDAHAVLAAYRLHGKQFLDVLHGGFAVVVIDRDQQVAYMAVDRMGIERLTYASRPSGLFFGTTPVLISPTPLQHCDTCNDDCSHQTRS